jgi:hypothetical protein
MTNYTNRVQVSNGNGSLLQNFNGVSTSDSLLYTKTIRVGNEIVATPMTNRWVNDATTSVLANLIVDAGLPLSGNGKTFIILEVVGVASGLDPINNPLNDSLIVLVTNPSGQVDATDVTAYHILNAVGNNLIMPWHITSDNIDALCNLDMGIGLAGSGRYYDVRVSVSYTRP